MAQQTLPSYLRPPEGPHLYGSLAYDSGSNSWVVQGEPCVVAMAKKLFPGCRGRGPGVARFKANRRTNGDLNWLMQRYPLKIENPDRWKGAITETIEHVRRRDQIRRQPQRITPPMSFKGELKTFQKEGLAFLLHNRRCLLADEMGLGKTVQALGFLAAMDAFPALVVVPPHLVLNWQKEINRFLTLPVPLGGNETLFGSNGQSIHIIRGLRPYKLPAASVYLIHYLLLRGWKKELPDHGFKAVIFDEIQELRHARTEKYSAASLLAESCDSVIGLSGTPIYNRGGEIWNVINIIEHHCLGDWEGFTREWCYGYGNDVVQKPDLLGDYLRREGLLLRRRKADVLKELPPKRRVVQTIDCDSGVFGTLIQNAVERAQRLDNIKDAFAKGRLVRTIVNDTRRATGIAKAPFVAAFVQMLLEAGEKVLLFAHHHAVFDIYLDKLRQFRPREITGRATAQQKNQAVQAFMNGDTSLVIISLRAASGLNLQNATCVVFGELDWSPAIHSQAEDRAHRMGQEDSILCYYLVTEEGTDMEIQDALGLKVSQFTGLMGDVPETEDDRALAQVKATEHMNRIVNKLKQKHPAKNQRREGVV